MTWEEVIIEVRKNPEFAQVVFDAYLDADIKSAIERFSKSLEFKETLALMQKNGIQPGARILDIGAGNGIATISFALHGYEVTAIEPDTSDTVGAGAIRKMVDGFQLKNVTVLTSTAENIENIKPVYDVVYIRQAVHHAAHLNQFVANAVSSLKPGGLYLAVRDHVIYNEKDKEWFLQSHPLHKYYGGENAFTLAEYLGAMKNAGLTGIKHLAYFDSPLNYLPVKPEELEQKKTNREQWVKSSLRSKIGPLASFSPFLKVYSKYVAKKLGPVLDETQIPGRPYSFYGVKPA